MSNSILTNSGANYISSKLSKVRDDQVLAQTQLASGLKSPDPANDPSGTAISLSLGSDVVIAKTIQEMAIQGGSMVSLAVGVLNNTAAVLSRMKELATQASSATISLTDKANLNAEYSTLVAQLDSNSQTQFAGQNILDGSFSGAIQIGTTQTNTVNLAWNTPAYSVKSADLGLAASDISNSADATAAITNITTAFNTVTTALANVSAVKSRLDVANQNMDTVVQNYEIAQSTYRDVNVTEALVNAQRASAVSSAASAAIQQNMGMFLDLSRMIQAVMR